MKYVIRAVENIVMALAYAAGAQIGFALAFLHSQVSPVWPPEGISLAAVLVFGFRVAPGVLLGAFLANYLNNPHLPTAALIAIGNTLSVLMAATMVRRFARGDNLFGRVRPVLKFLTIGTMPGALVSALIGVTALRLFDFVSPEAYPTVVLTWWTGEMQGLIIVAPFLYAWSRLPDRETYLAKKGRRILEAVALAVVLLAISVFVFLNQMHLTYLPIPLLIWAVFRYRLHGAVTAIAIVSGVATYCTVNQVGPFAIHAEGKLALNDSLLLLELYIGSLTVMTLVVAAVVSERAEALSKQGLFAQELNEQSAAFFRFVPDQFLKILGKRSAVDIQLGDSRQSRMSVLFSDIRSFTAISEKLTPQDNIELLNAYLARMEPIIHAHGGFVDKFIGDAIMALFDDERPGATGSSADRAVACAVEMQNQLARFNELREKRGEAPLECGIGVSTGPVVLGTVGSMMRLDTTVIGDTVNLASRLENLTARVGLSLLISAATLNAVRDSARFETRLLGTVTVKGKSLPVEIHEVFNADPPDARARKEQAGAFITQAFPLFVGGEFDQARPLFEQAHAALPERLTEMYIERCIIFARTPPPADWNGSEVLHAK